MQNQTQAMKQFHVRRTQLTKGSPILKNPQLTLVQQTIRNQSLLNEQQHMIRHKQIDEDNMFSNPIDKRIQKQNQQESIFQMKSSEHQMQQLNQLNMQLMTKNKILGQRLRGAQQLNEEFAKEIRKYQENQAQLEAQVQQLQEKVHKQKDKKRALVEQVDQLKQELEDMQEKYQNSSNQEMEDDGEQNDQPPLTHNQLYQLMQYLQARAQQQQWLYENLHEYQDQEVDPDGMTYEQLLELEEQIGNVSKGLTDEQIKIIPKRVLQTEDVPDDKCSVCLFEFKAEEKVRDLPCKHIYHSKCIKEWLQGNKCCPLCKTEIIIEMPDNDEDIPENENNIDMPDMPDMQDNIDNEESQQQLSDDDF